MRLWTFYVGIDILCGDSFTWTGQILRGQIDEMVLLNIEHQDDLYFNKYMLLVALMMRQLARDSSL